MFALARVKPARLAELPSGAVEQIPTVQAMTLGMFPLILTGSLNRDSNRGYYNPG